MVTGYSKPKQSLGLDMFKVYQQSDIMDYNKLLWELLALM